MWWVVWLWWVVFNVVGFCGCACIPGFPLVRRQQAGSGGTWTSPASSHTLLGSVGHDAATHCMPGGGGGAARSIPQAGCSSCLLVSVCLFKLQPAYARRLHGAPPQATPACNCLPDLLCCSVKRPRTSSVCHPPLCMSPSALWHCTHTTAQRLPPTCTPTTALVWCNPLTGRNSLEWPPCSRSSTACTGSRRTLEVEWPCTSRQYTSSKALEGQY